MRWWKQLTLEELESSTVEKAKRTFGEGALYPEGTEQLNPAELFKNALWHPGEQDQRFNDCVIHALNLYVGGPLFMSREHWCNVLSARRKIAKMGCLEDVRLHGVSLRNLNHIIYDSEFECWYSLRHKATIESATFDLYLYSDGLNILDFLNEVVGESCLIQWVDYPVDLIGGVLLSTRDSHAAVVRKVEDDWYILDSAENEPIHVNEDLEEAASYFCSIDFMHLYCLEVD